MEPRHTQWVDSLWKVTRLMVACSLFSNCTPHNNTPVHCSYPVVGSLNLIPLKNTYRNHATVSQSGDSARSAVFITHLNHVLFAAACYKVMSL